MVRNSRFRKKRPYWVLLVPVFPFLLILLIYWHEDKLLREHYLDYETVSGTITNYGEAYYTRPHSFNITYLYFTIDHDASYVLDEVWKDLFDRDRFEQEVQLGDVVTLTVNCEAPTRGGPRVMQIISNGTVYLSLDDSIELAEINIRYRQEDRTIEMVLAVPFVLLEAALLAEIFQKEINDWKWRH